MQGSRHQSLVPDEHVDLDEDRNERVEKNQTEEPQKEIADTSVPRRLARRALRHRRGTLARSDWTEKSQPGSRSPGARAQRLRVVGERRDLWRVARSLASCARRRGRAA